MEPGLERDAERRASPSAVPPCPSSPRLPWPAPPAPGEPSLLRASPALSPLSLPLQQVRAAGGDGRVWGRPTPGFLGAASLPLGVRVFGCFYSAPELIPRRSSPRASPTPPSGPPRLCPRCRLGSACGNDVRIGGSKFFTCVRGPPIFFLGNQIVLILLISKPEAAAGGTNAIFPLDSENLFGFYFYF